MVTQLLTYSVPFCHEQHVEVKVKEEREGGCSTINKERTQVAAAIRTDLTQLHDDHNFVHSSLAVGESIEPKAV